MPEPILVIDHTLMGIEYQIYVLEYEPYVPAQLYGPMEDCYPAEGGVGGFEIYYENEVAEDPDTGLNLQDSLTSEEVDEIQQLIFNSFEGER